VATIGLVLVLLVAGLATTSILFWRQRERADAAFAAEAREREHAEAARAAEIRQRGEARRAVDAMYSDVAEHLLIDLPGSEPLRREFLLKAVAYYEDFATEAPTDREMRHSAAWAAFRVGKLHSALNEWKSAEEWYERALARVTNLLSEDPNVPKAGCYSRGSCSTRVSSSPKSATRMWRWPPGARRSTCMNDWGMSSPMLWNISAGRCISGPASGCC
jgi:tetratricopeptide (TPR) repeat protein